MSTTQLDIERYAFNKLEKFPRILNLHSGFSHGSNNPINPSA